MVNLNFIFNIKPKEFRDKIQGNLVTSKLALLTIHFPRLKIFWCRSPKNSVDLFKFLKKNQLEPDAIEAQNSNSKILIL